MGRNGRSLAPCFWYQRLTALRSQSCFSAPSCVAMNSGNSGTTLECPVPPPSPPLGCDSSRPCHWNVCASGNAGSRYSASKNTRFRPRPRRFCRPIFQRPGAWLARQAIAPPAQSRVATAPDQPVEHVADVVVGGNFLDPEQRLAVGPAMTSLQATLKRQKRRALHEKHDKGREAEISHGNVAAAPLPAVRKGATNGFQTRNKGWQQLHPNRESFFR